MSSSEISVGDFHNISHNFTQIFQLLRKSPEERLGHGPDDGEAVKTHDFFRSIDWRLVESRKMTPPFVPKTVRIIYITIISFIVNDGIDNQNLE